MKFEFIRKVFDFHTVKKLLFDYELFEKLLFEFKAFIIQPKIKAMVKLINFVSSLKM